MWLPFKLHSLLVPVLLIFTVHGVTTAAALPEPPPQHQNQQQQLQEATCVLDVRGQHQSSGIAFAGMQCSGSSVTVAAVGSLLGRHKENFEGVIWDQQQCGLAAARCLLAVCGGATHLTLRDSTIQGVRGVNLDAVLCVLGVNVRVVNAMLAFNGVTSMLLANASAVITGNTIVAHNAVEGNGGGIRVGSNSAVHIDAATIAYNNATGSGAGVHVGEHALVVIAGNASIAHNNASGMGAGAFIGSNSVVRIEGRASLGWNVAGKDGGALAVESFSNISISGDVVIQHNSAGLTGGGIAIWDHSVVDLAGRASILFNRAISYGGGMYVDLSSVVKLSGSLVISHNRVTRDSGGGVMCWVNSIVDIGGSVTITHNRAEGEGGGVYVDVNSRINITGNATISNNTAVSNGGCVLIGKGSKATISVDLHGCAAGYEGGAIFAYQASVVHVKGTQFVGNKAIGGGSDVAAFNGSTLMFEGSNIAHLSSTVYWQRTVCEVGEVRGTESGYCTPCPRSMYSLNVLNTTCDVCPPNAYCPGRDVMLPLEGFWHSHKHSTQMHRCPKAGACAVNGTCGPGYESNMCGRCKAGFAAVGALHCEPCRSVSATVAIYALTWVLLVLLVAWLVQTTIRDNMQSMQALRPSDLVKVLLRHVQYLLLLISVRLPWPDTLSYLSSVVTYVLSSSISQVILLDCVLQAQRDSMMPTAVANKLVSLVTPISVLIAVLLLRMVVGSMRTRTCGCCTTTEVVVSSLVVLFFFYPTLVHTSLSMFACIPVDKALLASDPYPQFAISNATLGYWVWDMRLPCWQGTHFGWGLALGVPCVVCFCVLVPVALWVFLHANKARLTCQLVRSRVGFLYHCFTPKMYAYEAVAGLQTVLLVAVSTFSFTLGPYHACLLMLVGFLGIMAAQHLCRPYAFPQVHEMQLASTTCLVLTALTGLSLFEPSAVVLPQACKDAVGVLGLVTNVVFVCWSAYMAATLSEGELKKLVCCVKNWLGKVFPKCARLLRHCFTVKL